MANGGAGASIICPNGEEDEIRTPAGRLSSSYRSEMAALQSALAQLLSSPALDEDPVIICTDSQSALASLRDGPAAQTAPLRISIWRLLSRLAKAGRQVHLQWVPSHCGFEGNERADNIAKKASSLDQRWTSDQRRTAASGGRSGGRQNRSPDGGETIASQTKLSLQAWPAGWYRRLMGSRLPRPVVGGSRRQSTSTS